MEFEKLRDKHGKDLSNKAIAKMFGYKNPASFTTSSARPRIQQGIVELHKVFFRQFIEDIKEHQQLVCCLNNRPHQEISINAPEPEHI